MKGRKPVACPEHRRAAKRRVDARKKRVNYANGGPAQRPPCCVESGRQCPQHRQWKDFAKTWRYQVRRSPDDPIALVLAEVFAVEDGERINSGMHITHL
jgi:hypothetical protein